jgi:hypothetical protein
VASGDSGTDPAVVAASTALSFALAKPISASTGKAALAGAYTYQLSEPVIDLVTGEQGTVIHVRRVDQATRNS